MRVLIFHGYLLSGTGSNVYNASLAAALARAGHQVDLFCQDRTPLALDWVDAAGDWDTGSLRVDARREDVRATVYRPDIGGVLPVYVADRYDGIRARPFPELSDEEVEFYLAANAAAVREVCETARPDVALANHLVMGPVILARALAGTPVGYAVKIHGSALEYVVKPHPRFLGYAREGLEPARGILTGSRHTADSLVAALDDPGLAGRIRLGPPGVDVDAFAPREPGAGRAGLHDLIARLDALATDAAGDPSSSFARRPAEAARALAAVEPQTDRLVVFVGKLIGSKGVELLLAAWPLVVASVPDARLVLIGFGALRESLERLAAHLDAGDLEAARAITAEDGSPLAHSAFFDGLDADPEARDAYAATARGSARRVTWAGRLDHAELAGLLPVADAMVVPSTFPESFGMVAAEAAACGALPIVARHSGLAEVAGVLGEAVVPEARPWLGFELGPRAVHELATALEAWLTAPEHIRRRTRDAIVATTRARYSWTGVAETVIAAAQGELEDLPVP